MTNRVIGGNSEYTVNSFWRTIEEIHERLTPDLPSTVRGHNREGASQAEVMPELAPVEGDIVINSKHRLSSFEGTDLEATLRALQVDTLLLIGTNTNTCVQSAALEAFNRGSKVVVVSDCGASMYGDDLHESGLENVARCRHGSSPPAVPMAWGVLPPARSVREPLMGTCGLIADS